MIRLDAEVADMTEQDLKDTLPAINSEIKQWNALREGTFDNKTLDYAANKQWELAKKMQLMLERRNEFKSDNTIKGCPFDEILEK